MALQIRMLEAERGDALLVQYGPGDTLTHRVLIDGGPVNSGHYEQLRDAIRALEPAADGRRYFDLLIITHVDADHIEGIVRLLQDDELRCVFDDIWFNGWKHLSDLEDETQLDVLGAKHGEFLGALLTRQGRPWNQLAKGGPIVVPDDATSADDTTDSTNPLPVIKLRGGLQLTVLSPTVPKLQKLAKVWKREVEAAGFTPGDADAAYEALREQWWASTSTLGSATVTKSKDGSEANGASIAVLAEYGGRSVLLTGDAHDDVLTATLRRLRAERGLDVPLVIDAFKLSHHGSEKNTTPQLMAEVRAGHYLISSSGDRFNHPSSDTIKLIVDTHGVEPFALHFNYDQPNTEIWKDPGRDTRFGADAILTLDTA
jgi:beta-lactamase superfamily II metal-dependent hydrolase